jgi:P-type conjugative transfer protein TrbL
MHIRIVVLIILLPINLLATSIPATQDPTLYDDIVDSFVASANQWQPIFQNLGYRIFAALAAIQIVLELGLMAARGEMEFGGIATTFMRMFLIFGIFYGLIGAPHLFIDWFSSFNLLADQANTAAGGTAVHAANLFAAADQIFHLAIDNFSLFSFGKSMALILASFLAAILLVLLSIELLITILKFYFTLYINIIMMGFAALQQTRQWAINGVTNLLKIGLELLMIKLIIGLSITTIMQFANDASNNDNQSLIYLVILVLSLFSLAKMVHPMVESFFMGFGVNNNNFGQRVGQAGLSSATNSIAQGYNNMKTSAKSQLSFLKTNQTMPNSVSPSGQATGGANGSSSNNMNTPITMGSIGKTIGKGSLKATVGTLKAVADIGGNMAKEALDVRQTSNSEKTSSQEQYKKFPTNYTPPSQNSSK